MATFPSRNWTKRTNYGRSGGESPGDFGKYRATLAQGRNIACCAGIVPKRRTSQDCGRTCQRTLYQCSWLRTHHMEWSTTRNGAKSTTASSVTPWGKLPTTTDAIGRKHGSCFQGT